MDILDDKKCHSLICELALLRVAIDILMSMKDSLLSLNFDEIDFGELPQLESEEIKRVFVLLEGAQRMQNVKT